jgi:hypothetical protein
VFKGLLEGADHAVPVLQPGIDRVLFVLAHLDQAGGSGLVLRVVLINAQVVIFSSGRVHSPLLQSLLGFKLRKFEEADQGWTHVHALEHVDLSLGLGEAVHNPAVHSAVTLLKSLFNEGHYD